MKSLRAVAVRRVLSLAGAAVVATMVAVGIPSPADAHHPIITGAATCEAATGTWKVTWKVANSEWDLTGTLTAVSLTPATGSVSNIVVGATLPTSREAPLTGVQILGGDASRAGLEVTAFWQRPGHTVTRSASASVELRGSCRIPRTAKPGATFASNCDGSVTTTLINGADATRTARFKVTGSNGFEKTANVSPSASTVIEIPAANTAAITIKAGGVLVASGKFEDPKDCAAPQTTIAKTCISLSAAVSNPDGGRVVTGSLTPSVGDKVTFTLKPGEETASSFTGTDGLTVAMTVTGLDDTTLTWAKPSSCIAPPSTPELPDTGTNLTAAISGGAALVALGAGILFFFRRRRGAHARF